MSTIITPAKHLILHPISNIFQMPKFIALDHAAGLVYVCDRIYNTPSHLPLYYTEYDLKDTKEQEPEKSTTAKLLIADRIMKSGLKGKLYTIVSTYARDISDLESILDNEVEDFILRTEGDIRYMTHALWYP